MIPFFIYFLLLFLTSIFKLKYLSKNFLSKSSSKFVVIIFFEFSKYLSLANSLFFSLYSGSGKIVSIINKKYKINIRMKQKGGKFQSNYKMEHISNINGSITSNKIIAKGNDGGINIITQKNNDKPEHIFINLDQFVNKLDRGEKDLFSKLRQLMDKEEHKSHPLILKNSYGQIKHNPAKIKGSLQALISFFSAIL